MYGRKTKHLLTHPECVLCVNEVGANTSQKQDGHIGGRKLVVEKERGPKNAKHTLTVTLP
jgi:hypothetical protein